jgi:alkanesulfonate monooxygenase SsuD/methylene tetrahydromethanopterin reductase-like flavin-dependent oxidoreductase (luciferase family)
MRLGALLMPADPWHESLETAQSLESLGYHHLWVYDHLSWQRYQDGPWHATYPWLTGIAAGTDRIRLGTMVSNPNIRHPLLLAKDAMTIDHISSGRLTLGIGAGGTGFDASALGQAPLSPAQRIGRLEEFVAVLDGLLRGELHDHAGDNYRINGARLLPGCVQEPRIPVAIAAGGRRGLALVAAAADAWITYGDTSHKETSDTATERVVRRQIEMLEERCAAIGRDPAGIDRIYLIGNTDDRPLVGIDAFTDFVGRYNDLGFTDIVFHHPRPDDPIWNDAAEIVEEIAAVHLA